VIIVADSAPLHYLILLDLPDLLPQLYGDVLVEGTLEWWCSFRDRVVQQILRRVSRVVLL